MQAKEWAIALREGELKERLSDNRGNLKFEKTQAQIVGKLFSDYAGEQLSCQAGDFVLRKRQISSRPVRQEYYFESVETVKGNNIPSPCAHSEVWSV